MVTILITEWPTRNAIHSLLTQLITDEMEETLGKMKVVYMQIWMLKELFSNQQIQFQKDYYKNRNFLQPIFFYFFLYVTIQMIFKTSLTRRRKLNSKQLDLKVF